MGGTSRPTQPTVLVVEGEAIVRLDLAQAFKDVGFDVIEVTNADEAIETLARTTDIHVVVTAVEMTGSIDGVKLAWLVRDRWPPVHIIVTSGRRWLQDGDLPNRSRFFTKPYNVLHLIQAVRIYMA
jgi:CheY-like chemotaxis protein